MATQFDMRVKLHRGAAQIGGTCIEVEAEGRSLLLDLGLPLDATDEASTLPDLGTVFPTLEGVALTHPHRDHFGLIRRLPPSVPAFLGEAAHRILLAGERFNLPGLGTRAVHTWRDGVPFQRGPFRVTPMLVDHSAFDAHALLIEAGGRRLLYSGDFRGHGRKRALFERMLREPPRHVDVLLMEGTVLGRPARRFETEDELELRFVEHFRRTRGAALVCASAQNIDRVVSIFRASRRTGRTLVIDLYAAEILRATGRSTIPQGWWDGVRVFVPSHHRRAAIFPPWRRTRVFDEELATLAPRATFLFRASLAHDLERAQCLSGARVVWSQWDGYLRARSTQKLRDWIARQQLPLSSVHTSGHASLDDLQRFAAAVAARKLVPVHTEHAVDFPQHFDNVVQQEDGRWLDV